MTYLLDVNALIALHDIAHPQNGAAFDWFDKVRDEPWASCPLTENGFARIISQPRYTAPVPLVLAVDLLRDTIRETDHEFWPDDISLLDGKLFRPKHLIGHRQVTDAYLLALVVKHGGRLVTFDGEVPVDAVVGATKDHVVKL